MCLRVYEWEFVCAWFVRCQLSTQKKVDSKNRYRARIHSILAYEYCMYKNECAGYLYQVSSVSLSICKSCKYVLGDAAQIWSTHFLVSSHSTWWSAPLVLVLRADCSCKQLWCKQLWCCQLWCQMHVNMRVCGPYYWKWWGCMQMHRLSRNARCAAGRLCALLLSHVSAHIPVFNRVSAWAAGEHLRRAGMCRLPSRASLLIQEVACGLSTSVCRHPVGICRWKPPGLPSLVLPATVTWSVLKVECVIVNVRVSAMCALCLVCSPTWRWRATRTAPNLSHLGSMYYGCDIVKHTHTHTHTHTHITSPNTPLTPTSHHAPLSCWSLALPPRCHNVLIAFAVLLAVVVWDVRVH